MHAVKHVLSIARASRTKSSVECIKVTTVSVALAAVISAMHQESKASKRQSWLVPPSLKITMSACVNAESCDLAKHPHLASSKVKHSEGSWHVHRTNQPSMDNLCMCM